MRKFNALLLALSLTPAAGYPLGLGDISLHSGLNQPLSAEIELLSVASEDVPTVEVSLASYDTFARMGVDRPALLSLIEFTVEQRANGAYYIKASSEKPIREAFLDFLIEVNWRSGRLLREYTVLLDPPASGTDTAPALQAPVVAPPARVQRSAPASVPKPAAADMSQPLTGAALQAAAAVAAAAPAADATVAAAPRRRSNAYGPVKADDTLWSIARKMRPDDSVTIPQVMVALVKGNPHAFYDGNANRMKAGTVLRLDPELLRSTGKDEAQREVVMQGRAWEQYKQQAAQEAPGRSPSGEAALERAGAVASATEPRLKLVAPEAGAGTGAGEPTAGAAMAKNGDALRKELILVQEASEAQKQENAELRRRVQELETQINSMQRLMSLKSDDLATLQQKAAQDAAAQQGPVVQPPAETAVAAAPAGAAAPTASEAVPADAAAVAPEQPAAVPAPKPKPVPVAPPAVPEPSLLDNPLLMGGAMLLAVMGLGGVAYLVIRRRRSGGNFTESILMGGTPSMLKAKAAEGKPSEETSFFSDFAVSGMGDIHAEDSEVDPLTEADVYMAYQRFQQAEELIKDALKQHPNRPELHVKLLEVHHATRNKTAFEAEALQTHALLNGTGPLWEKVLVIGHDLLPDHPLFAKAPEQIAAGGPSHADARLDNEVLDIGLDLDALTEEMESGGDHGFNLDLGVDFSDLDDVKAPATEATKPAESAPAAAAKAAPAPAAENPFELDFGDLNLDAEAPAAPAATPLTASSAAPVAETAEDEEPELHMDLSAVPEPQQAPAAEAFHLGDLDLDAMDLGMESAAKAEEPASAAMPAATHELDLNELDLSSLDLGQAEPDIEAAPAPDADMDLPPLDDLTMDDVQEDQLVSMDEIGTKLDLARAYVGMGDSEGARSLLDEVVQEGNDAQQREAKELLAQIA